MCCEPSICYSGLVTLFSFTALMDAHGDEELLRRAKEGPEGIAAVYDAYADRVYGFCLARCGHRETAEDLVSKTFMKFCQHVGAIHWQGVSLGAWLFRVASNLLIDHWRSMSVRMDEPLDESDEEGPAHELPSSLPSPEAYAEHVVERGNLLEALKTLSPRDQEVIDLRFFGQRDAQEIASILQITSNHAAVLVYRATGRLSAKYKQLYGT